MDTFDKFITRIFFTQKDSHTEPQNIQENGVMGTYDNYLQEELSVARRKELFDLGKAAVTGVKSEASGVIPANALRAFKQLINNKILEKRRLLPQWKAAVGHDKKMLYDEIKTLEREIFNGLRKIDAHERSLSVQKMVDRSKSAARRGPI